MKRHILSYAIPCIVMANDSEDIGALVAEMRKTHEQMQDQTKGLPELQKKFDHLNTQIDKFEEKNQTLVLELEKEKGAAAEVKEHVERLEKQLVRVHAGSEEFEQKSKELKFFEDFVVKGEASCRKGMGVEEIKQYLRTDDNEQGGFLMQDSFNDMIIKPITEISPIRQLATTRQIDGLSDTQYRRDSLVRVFHTGEGEEFAQSNSRYGKLRIPVHSLTGETRISNRALLGSRFNMESEIMEDLREAIAEVQGRMFVRGDGEGRPQGFMAPESVTQIERINSGTANSFDFDALINITGQLKTGYNPIYAFNRRTSAFIRTLKDDRGAYVWQSGNLAAGVPNTINGYGYMEVIDMDDVGANNEPVIFADFRRLYTIVDAFNAIVLRNPYKVNGMVEYTIEMWYGGQTTLGEAGKVLRCATN